MGSRALGFRGAVVGAAVVLGSHGTGLAQTAPEPAPAATQTPATGHPAPAPAGSAQQPSLQPPSPQQPYPQQPYPQQPSPQQSYPQQPSPQQPSPQQSYPQQPYPQQPYPPGYYPPPPQGYAPGYYPPPQGAPPGYYPPPQGYTPGYYPPSGAPPTYYGAPQEYQTPAQRPVRRVDVRAVVTGSVTLGVAWSISTITAAVLIDQADGRPTGAEPLFVPVIGPFIALGTMGAFDQQNGPEFGVLLILDGLAQTGGLVSIVLGSLGRSDAAWAKSPLVPEVQVGAGTTRLKWQF